ncbi:HlyD family secretion protein [Brucella pseudogrignonensis]|uniref:HlyD family secretion protein n=1 Tax=Brucella pseudogrignonensis TaxID=419475 RepID=UPI00124DD02C|nr:HlyD family secretion protein [Brucella pseudogrignonensis]KAB2684484.1 HlyD family secretion protein [Brucella pseudogrignonensis]
MSSSPSEIAKQYPATEEGVRYGWPLRLAPWLACITVVCAVVYTVSAWDAWTSNRPYQRTQNAFVKAEFAVLSARVGGYVRRLPVADYQRVKAGDIVAEIETDEYTARFKAAEASLAKAQAALNNLENEEAQQRAAIRQAEASLRAAQARLKQSQQDSDRKIQLVSKGSVSQKSFDDAKAELASSQASQEAAEAALSYANRQLDTLSGQRAQRTADRDIMAASLDSARLELKDTAIVAPFDGTLGRRGIQIGSLVASGTQIVTIVPLNQLYVVANYKETQLKNVRSGQPAEIKIDALPGNRFRGRVEQVAPMSGNEASLFPTDNAAGNFTKVVQRIPVRVALDPDQEDLDLLRPGMSADILINTLGDEIEAYSLRPLAGRGGR